MRMEQKQLEGRDLLEKVQNETYWRNKSTQEYIECAKQAAEDSDRKKRLKEKLCKHCYYLRGAIIAGQAFTTTTCTICVVEMTFSSTHTDKLCTTCAKEHNLCRQCMSDIDYKKRRKV